MQDINLYEKIIMYDDKFPVKLGFMQEENVAVNTLLFQNHWHEHLELWYLEKGEVIISHNGQQSVLHGGDLAIANSNELHAAYTVSKALKAFWLIIDPKFFDTELWRGHFVFRNIISGDPAVKDCFGQIFEEHKNHTVGFDMAIKAKLYELLVYLVRNHICRHVTQEEYVARVNKLERILPAVQYIEHHYNTEISYTELAQLLNVSKYHFCHLFKEATGKTVVQYINDVRLDKAYHLLKNTDMNITQISMSVGFNDMNYFSRLFRKYKNVPPSKVRSQEKRVV